MCDVKKNKKYLHFTKLHKLCDSIRIVMTICI